MSTEGIHRELTVSHHPMLGACVEPLSASIWGIIQNSSLEPRDFLLRPQRPQQNGKICPYVGLPWIQRLHRDCYFLTRKNPADVKSSQCQRPQ